MNERMTESGKVQLSSLLASVVLVLAGGCLGQRQASVGTPYITTSENVSPGDTNRSVLPVSQILSPAGRQVELPGLRPQVLALSPDGRLRVTSSKSHELQVL